MTTRQIRAQLNAPKRKYALPLLIPRLCQRAQTLRQEWNTPKPTTNPYDLVRALLPQTHQSGLPPRIMNLHLPAS